jgi:hypothetical protein
MPLNARPLRLRTIDRVAASWTSDDRAGWRGNEPAQRADVSRVKRSATNTAAEIAWREKGHRARLPFHRQERRRTLAESPAGPRPSTIVFTASRGAPA